MSGNYKSAEFVASSGDSSDDEPREKPKGWWLKSIGGNCCLKRGEFTELSKIVKKGVLKG